MMQYFCLLFFRHTEPPVKFLYSVLFTKLTEQSQKSYFLCRSIVIRFHELSAIDFKAIKNHIPCKTFGASCVRRTWLCSTRGCKTAEARSHWTEVIVETILLINRSKLLLWCQDVSKLKWNYMNFVEIGILVSEPSNYCKAVKTRSHKWIWAISLKMGIAAVHSHHSWRIQRKRYSESFIRWLRHEQVQGHEWDIYPHHLWV